MKIKKGDTVEVLDDSISGKVLRVNTNEVTFETPDGFEMTFLENELVVINEIMSVANYEVSAAMKEKENKRRKTVKVTPKKRRDDPRLEVDLHIEKLVPSTRGMTNFDILNLQLETAERQLNFAMRKRIQKVVFIHGVGEGVLKTELEYMFGRYNNIKFYDADYSKYGLGAMEIYILQNS
ncbi:hypothetical protein NBRC110019_22790 [Neptunitalea chrysea]|uniref:Smr domain-containing protein n=1 Tax=Neptunitalea chrysea TaxID=1647581 RepID=A0A9W6EV07_9FLAO|nr:Smr/MutS family protein [Neptunitalea chrysea]GLB53239.1 hypothetical protein NBRC110019_22790 [Neptunitalea chrysea]